MPPPNEQTEFDLKQTYVEINSKVLELWQITYDALTNIDYYKKLEPKVSFNIKYNSKNHVRNKTITRLRTGKAFLNDQLFKMKKHPTGLFDHCPNKKETVTHFLTECPKYNILNATSSQSITDLFTDDSKLTTLLKIISDNNKIYRQTPPKYYLSV